jgi:hypothetical protein
MAVVMVVAMVVVVVAAVVVAVAVVAAVVVAVVVVAVAASAAAASPGVLAGLGAKRVHLPRLTSANTCGRVRLRRPGLFMCTADVVAATALAQKFR